MRAGGLNFREAPEDGGSAGGIRAGGVSADDGAHAAQAGAAGGKAGLIDMDEAFYERVYAQVRQVPPGTVCTYGAIAELAGYPRAAREVGLAMSRVQRAWNLPCHRIVNAKGTLAPSYAFGGKANQRKLLEDEGVTFLDEDTIDMKRHRWPPSNEPEQLSLGI